MTAGAKATAPGALPGAAAAALGLHVWIAMIVLPGALSGALVGVAAPVAALAPAALALGLARRSADLLLVGFPAAVAAAAIAAPEVVSSHAYDAIRFAAVASSLVGYSFFAAAHTTRRLPAVPARPLAGGLAIAAPRWRRRTRVFRGLAALSVAFPALWIYAIHFHAENRAYLRAMYPGRAEALTATLALVAIVAWIALFRYAFAGVLAAHGRGDRDLRIGLAQLRGEAARSHRPALFLGVATAIVLTLLLAALRLRAGGS